MLIHSDQIINGNACIFQDSNTVQVLGEYNCCVPAVKCGRAVLGRGAARGAGTPAQQAEMVTSSGVTQQTVSQL